MGRHSTKQKREKRRNQKRRKRQKLKHGARTDCSSKEGINESNDGQGQSGQFGSDSCDQGSHTCELCSEQIFGDPVVDTEVSSPGSQQSEADTDDGGLFAALDRVSEESDAYWNEMVDKKIKEFESYRDVHPCIVTDKKRSIRIYVDGTGPYKGSAAIRRVAMEDYFGRLMKQQTKATELCQLMRDRVENLEDALKDSKVKMMRMHRENQRKIEKVRYFWRNKIFEGNCRGGELLKSALAYPDMYS